MLVLVAAEAVVQQVLIQMLLVEQADSLEGAEELEVEQLLHQQHLLEELVQTDK